MRGPFRLLAMLRAALSFLPSMLAKFGGVVIICAALLVAFVVVTGIGGDALAAFRAEIKSWRNEAEAEVIATEAAKLVAEKINLEAEAAESLSEISNSITNKSQNVILGNHMPTSRRSDTAVPATLSVSEILDHIATIQAAISPEKRPGFLTDMQQAILDACGATACTQAAMGTLVQSGSLKIIYDRHGMPPDRDARRDWTQQALLLDRLKIKVN